MKLREAKVTAGCRCYSRACARWGEKGRGGRGESLIKDLKRKANSLSRVPGRPALLGWRGDPRPSKTAPIGMTKSARCGGGGGGGERLINDLKRQAHSMSRGSEQASAQGWRRRLQLPNVCRWPSTPSVDPAPALTPRTTSCIHLQLPWVSKWLRTARVH